jgi:hypothetical protein
MTDVVAQQRLGAGARPAGVAGRNVPGIVPRRLCCPGIQPAIRPPGGERVERRLRRALVEQARPGAFLWPAHLHGVPVDYLGNLGCRVVQVADEDGLHRADGDAGRLEADVQPVGAEVAFLGGVVLWVDEDRVVGAGRDARLAADAGTLVEVDDPVVPLVHGRCRTGGHARRVRALVAPGHLKGAPHLRERANLRGFHIGPGHPERDLVLAFAGRRACVTANAGILVEHLHPALQEVIRAGHASDGKQARPAPVAGLSL